MECLDNQSISTSEVTTSIDHYSKPPWQKMKLFFTHLILCPKCFFDHLKTLALFLTSSCLIRMREIARAVHENWLGFNSYQLNTNYPWLILFEPNWCYTDDYIISLWWWFELWAAYNAYDVRKMLSIKWHNVVVTSSYTYE